MTTKTQQLQTTASRIFGDSVHIEYRPGGIRSGWYISKGEHSYCFGKNWQEAVEWLVKAPIFQTTDMVDYTIVRNIKHSLTQLSVDPHESRIAGSFLLRDIINLTKVSPIATIAWLWCLGIPIRRIIGNYPNLFIEKVKSPESKIAKILSILSGKSNSFQIIKSNSSFDEYSPIPILATELHSFKLQEYSNLDDIPFMGTKAFYGHILTIWLRHLLIQPTREIEHVLQICHEYYNSVTAPLFHPTDINNTIVILTVWKLLCGFVDADQRLEEDIATSILITLQPQERVTQ